MSGNDDQIKTDNKEFLKKVEVVNIEMKGLV